MPRRRSSVQFYHRSASMSLQFVVYRQAASLYILLVGNNGLLGFARTAYWQHEVQRQWLGVVVRVATPRGGGDAICNRAKSTTGSIHIRIWNSICDQAIWCREISPRSNKYLKRLPYSLMLSTLQHHAHCIASMLMYNEDWRQAIKGRIICKKWRSPQKAPLSHSSSSSNEI